MSRHIVKAFDEDLRTLSALLAQMGGRAEDQLKKALEAVQTRDIKLAEAVIASDKILDSLELELESRAIDTIALRQPMASDLREVVAALKVASTLERVGDLAKSIAKRACILAEHKSTTVTNGIVRMGQLVLTELAAGLDAYIQRDKDKAVEVWRRDVAIDDFYNSLFREIVTYMMEDPRLISRGAELMFIAKNLERIGDHTTFISEMVYYVVTGIPLGDDRPKGNPSGSLI